MLYHSERNTGVSPTATAATLPQAVPVYDARAMIGRGDVARIRLGDQLYTLRITRAGKLILTK